MFLPSNPNNPRRAACAPSRPSGFSLLEVVVALSIMVIIMGSLGALAKAVNEGAVYGETYGNATQHARVAVERIAAAVRGATASDEFPAFLVIERNISGWDFPDTLVVWHPEGAAVDPNGLPRMNELRVYCPNPASPNELIEVTFPNDLRVVPSPHDKSAWVAEAETAEASNQVVHTVLTDMLRTALVTNLASSRRGCVRFEARYRPSPAEMAAYDAGSRSWSDLAWPQGIYSTNIGLRQAWLRIELQLVPASTSVASRSPEVTAIPFLGSAARFYEVHP